MPLRHRVSLEIEGIPAHAWNLRIARKLLASSCWVERMDHSPDMAFLALQAWTDKPSRIPRKKLLRIAEHELEVLYDDPVMQSVFGNLPRYLRQKMVLQYEVLIHLRRIADFNPRSPSPSPSPPSDDGDSGQDGDPDRDYGGPEYGGPTYHGFPVEYGLEDGAPYAAYSAAFGRRHYHFEHVAPSHDGGADAMHDGRQQSAVATSPAPALFRATASEPLLPANLSPSSPADATGPTPTVAADAERQLRSVGATTEQDNDRPVHMDRSPDKTIFAESGNREDNDKIELEFELISFESQLPAQTHPTLLEVDPMRFECCAAPPRRPQRVMSCRPTATTPTPCKTYRRRPRSDAAQLPASAALPPASAPSPAAAATSRAVPQAVAPLDAGTVGTDAPGLESDEGPIHNICPAKRARAELCLAQDNPSPKCTMSSTQLDAAKAATTAFLSSVRKALQLPLAQLPPCDQPATSPSVTPQVFDYRH
jgi:hypothetical protein